MSSGSRGVEAGEYLLRRERPRVGGGEFDRQRECVEAAADLGDLAVAGEVAADGPRALAEEIDRLLLVQRWHRVLVLGGQPEWLAARGE